MSPAKLIEQLRKEAAAEAALRGRYGVAEYLKVSPSHVDAMVRAAALAPPIHVSVSGRKRARWQAEDLQAFTEARHTSRPTGRCTKASRNGRGTNKRGGK